MTQTAGQPPVIGRPPLVRERVQRHAGVAHVPDLCPLLLAEDGSWRSAGPSRDHRCAALGPDVPLGLDKQRRLCLRDAHRSCATYSAAMRLNHGARDGDPAEQLVSSGVRPYPRMAPVVLDHGRLGRPQPRIPTGRGTGQRVLAGLMVAAFAVIAITRLPAPDPSQGGFVAGATSPAVSPSAPTLAPAPSPTPAVTHPRAPTAAPVTPAPPVASPPAPSPVRTYTIKAGDTLSGIASEFGTTVKALIDLNGIEDPRRIRAGQELELP